jgi:hypothetical protein
VCSLHWSLVISSNQEEALIFNIRNCVATELIGFFALRVHSFAVMNDSEWSCPTWLRVFPNKGKWIEAGLHAHRLCVHTCCNSKYCTYIHCDLHSKHYPTCFNVCSLKWVPMWNYQPWGKSQNFLQIRAVVQPLKIMAHVYGTLMCMCSNWALIDLSTDEGHGGT